MSRLTQVRTTFTAFTRDTSIAGINNRAVARYRGPAKK